MTLEKKRNALWLSVVFIAFIISRAWYDAREMTFQAEAIFGYWQMIDPGLLRADLWRSVFYLHSQPPLLNLFTGIVLQLFPENYEAAFHGVYYGMGFALAGGLYWAGISLRLPNWLSALAAISFTVSPATVLYEHWLMYAYPLAVLLTLSVVFLCQFIQTKNMIWGAVFFSTLAGMCLMWSLFHLIWLFGIAAGLYWLWGEKKKVVHAALIPILVVTGWYAKNLWLVGDFTSSSWAGMNLAKIATFRVGEEERASLVKAGVISPFALIPPFRNPLVYLELLPDTPQTGIPILDHPETSLGRRNHHHLVYAEASQYYLKDALAVIVRKPGVYLRGIMQAAYLYFHSASDYEFLEANRARIHDLDRIWNRVFYLQWQSGEDAGKRLNEISVSHVGWNIILVFIVTIAGGLIFLKKSRQNNLPHLTLPVMFIIYNILFVTFISIGMDIGENNRFRYAIDPLLLILFIFLAREFILGKIKDWMETHPISEKSGK